MVEEEDDTSNTRPVLVHIDRDDWEQFKKMVGERQASKRVRFLVRQDLNAHLTTATR